MVQIAESPKLWVVHPFIDANTLAEFIAYVKAKRSRSMSALPTVAEKAFPGFEAGSWFGFFAPKGSPESVINLINSSVNAVISQPTTRQQMIREGADPTGRTPLQFAQFTQNEFQNWKVTVLESAASVN